MEHYDEEALLEYLRCFFADLFTEPGSREWLSCKRELDKFSGATLIKLFNLIMVDEII